LDVVDAIEADSRGDYATELKLLRPLAEQGNIGAQDRLGMLYASGRGAPLDETEAVKWFRKAADQGDAEGQFDLGSVYDQGRGVPQDYTEAVKWYRKAADQGDAPGQFALAVAYMSGQEVPKDYVQAYVWVNLAIAGGFKPAEEVRNGLKELMTPAQVSTAEQRAAAWHATPSGEFTPPLLWWHPR
jgi:uncharacterized protein